MTFKIQAKIRKFLRAVPEKNFEQKDKQTTNGKTDRIFHKTFISWIQLTLRK